MKKYIHETKMPNNISIKKDYDVIVIGGGMSGLCAAIASGRNGARTALIQDRSVLGGNASSEIRMHIAGASCHWGKKNAAETGILMELQLDNKHINFNHNYSIWDGVLWSKAKSTENLDLYMNTVMTKVDSDGKTINKLECYQNTTESTFEMKAGIYIDATGNGTLGYYAGAEYRIGCEDKKAFGEKNARNEYNGETMGNTILFCSRDTGHPVKFVKPDWAYTFDESDFKHRYHGDITVYHDADDVVVLKKGESYEDHPDQLVEKYDVQSGYWWIELGGDWDDIIKQSEDIRWELYKTVYGVWDHIKNGGDHGAENYELSWVGAVAGMRESRRLEGQYMLTEQDIVNNRIFDDAVAYGGWPMDEHTAAGFRAKGQIPSKVRSFNGLYSIPYGCYVSKTINNLMMAGRDISTSKIALGSTRVMATCSIGGQAVGTAAALAVKYNCLPWDINKNHIKELQQILLKDDCYIIGQKNEDPLDKVRKAKITATSFIDGFEPCNIINGITRSTDDCSNLWKSDGLGKNGETLYIKLQNKDKLHEIRITFDPNLSEEHCISVSKSIIEKIPIGVPQELVKNYLVLLYNEGNLVYKNLIENNYQRLNIITLNNKILCDEIQIKILETNGCKDARVFEVRAY